jgi:hypothetical protein
MLKHLSSRLLKPLLFFEARPAKTDAAPPPGLRHSGSGWIYLSYSIFVAREPAALNHHAGGIFGIAGWIGSRSRGLMLVESRAER